MVHSCIPPRLTLNNEELLVAGNILDYTIVGEGTLYGNAQSFWGFIYHIGGVASRFMNPMPRSWVASDDHQRTSSNNWLAQSW